MKIKNILKVEEGLLVLLSIYLFILAPDIGMLGYLVNNKVGALTYNIFHHKGLAIIVYIIGIYLRNEAVQMAGIIILGHASIDRLLGFGLKYPENFKHTHLGYLK
jgi:hypothetical protein